MMLHDNKALKSLEDSTPEGETREARPQCVVVDYTSRMVARSEAAGSARPGCPDETALAEFIGGGATDAEREAIEGHIDGCPRCAATVGEYALAFASRTGNAAGAPDVDEEPGLPSRYRIECCVGFGAGGTVYRAHDRELDRVVALKVLHEGTSDSTTAGGRLAREAKIMAKVVHPNVVTVHDVGIAGERLFIATEFVDGSTLDAWCKEARRSWGELVDVFVEAGRGLAAIHACGLVHRDFKPHNVMVGRDGRVRVTDFGLARLMPELDELERERVQESSPALMLIDETLSQTRSGALVGTPAYMAPEQLRGERADARSDQFAYCVALYEALWGQRPFSSGTLAALAHSVCNDPPRPPPSRPRVPRWLVQVVMRGLSRKPDNRFEDMHALLHALTEAPRRRRRRRAGLALVGGFALMAGGGYAAAGLAEDACDLDEHRFAGIWDHDTRQAVAGALNRTPEIGEAVIDELDQWLAAWAATRRQACEAAVADRTSPRQLELQRTCLDRRVSELRAATEVLSEPDDGLSERALDVVGTIGAPQRCVDIETLETIEPTWASPLGRVLSREISGDLDRVEALREAGRIDEALALAERVLARVDDSEHLPVRAEALLALGLVQTVARDLDTAETTLHEGIWAAEASGHVAMAARGWLAISKIMVGGRSDLERGRQADSRASAAVHRLNDPLLELELAANRMGMAYIEGRYEDALEQSADLVTRSKAVYGEEDPQIGRLLFNMAAALHGLGRLEEAVDHAYRSLAIFEGRFGGRHPDLVEMLNGVAVIELDRGDVQAARGHVERGLALAHELFPEDQRGATNLIANLAAIDMSEGRHAAAVEGYGRVLELQRAIHDGVHPDIGITLHNLGVATGEVGDRERAIELFREALDVHRETVGPDHPTTADTLHSLGRALLAAGRHDEALEHLQRALEQRTEGAPRPRAATLFVLARTHAERGATKRARAHAEAALEALEGSNPRHDDLREEIEAWLTENGEIPRGTTVRPR
jgi:eukaryotic-like serine/threonine-protein kinase